MQMCRALPLHRAWDFNHVVMELRSLRLDFLESQQCAILGPRLERILDQWHRLVEPIESIHQSDVVGLRKCIDEWVADLANNLHTQVHDFIERGHPRKHRVGLLVHLAFQHVAQHTKDANNTK